MNEYQLRKLAHKLATNAADFGSYFQLIARISKWSDARLMAAIKKVA
jgi:hypothetical protein